LTCRSIRHALASTSLAAVVIAAGAIVQGCATRHTAPSKQAPIVAKAVPSATPTPTGAPIGNRSPFAITAGLDGNLWFTEFQGDDIGEMTPYGATKRFPIDPDGFAERITAGPDGAVWFTDTVGNRIGRVAPDGKIAYVKLPHSGSGPAGITLGPDGNLWFTEHSGDRIGRLSTIGTLTEIGRPAGTATCGSPRAR
jgi:virginiamycin B lyase